MVKRSLYLLLSALLGCQYTDKGCQTNLKGEYYGGLQRDKDGYYFCRFAETGIAESEVRRYDIKSDCPGGYDFKVFDPDKINDIKFRDSQMIACMNSAGDYHLSDWLDTSNQAFAAVLCTEEVNQKWIRVSSVNGESFYFCDRSVPNSKGKIGLLESWDIGQVAALSKCNVLLPPKWCLDPEIIGKCPIEYSDSGYCPIKVCIPPRKRAVLWEDRTNLECVGE